MMIKDDPVALTQYTEKHNLLKTKQWRCLRPYHKKKKFIMNMITKAFVGKQRNEKVKFKLGVQVPNNYLHAVN